MPIRVKELERYEEASNLKEEILDFLKKHKDEAYPLKELHQYFLDKDKVIGNYKGREKVLYHLIYGYLRRFVLDGSILKKKNFYYYNEKNK